MILRRQQLKAATWIASSSIVALCATAGATSAQVLEVGGGRVAVYDRPSVFTLGGAEPIMTAPPVRAPPHARERRRRPGASSAVVADAAALASLSPALIEAVAGRESGGRPGLRSRKGALGEMQLMPSTAHGLKIDPSDTRQNYRGGAAYLAAMMRRYDGDLQRALAAYNAGPGAVDRHRGVPPFPETQAYVASVLDRLSRRADTLGE